MLTRIDLRGFGGDVAERLPRPVVPSDGPVDAVRDILREVRTRGDDALREFTHRFDGVELTTTRVDPAEIRAARNRVPADVLAALEAAAANIAAYHEAQMPGDVAFEGLGLSIAGMHRAVERAGCYVPGGRAVYPSTVLMTAVPARVAGGERDRVVRAAGPRRAGARRDTRGGLGRRSR